MQSLARDGYTKQEIMDVLHSKKGPRTLRFRYDLLDNNNRYIRTLNNVLSGEISMSAFAEIKRTARFSLKDDGQIDFLNDRIQPFVELKMPEIYRPYTDYEHVVGVNLVLDSSVEHIFTNTIFNKSLVVDVFREFIGEQLTISFEAKAQMSGQKMDCYLRNVTAASIVTGSQKPSFEVGTEYTRYLYTITLSDISNVTSLSLAFRNTSSAGGTVRGAVSVKNIKIEEGALATQWSPNPSEDPDYEENWMKKVIKLETIPSKFISFPQGIFLLSTPKRKDQTNGVFRDVEAYGGLVILRDDKFETRYVIEAGTKYYDAVINILASAGISKYNIEYTDAVLARALEFEPGKEKLFAINELLSQINYTPIWDDVNGVFTSSYYRSPAVRAIDYTYLDDELSVTYQGVEEELDLFNVPNKWVVVCSNPEQEPLVSVYINDNPDSPTSTVSRGRIIVDYREAQDIADQSSLDAYVQRIAFEASQVYGKITFETAIMPMHDYADILEIDYSPLQIKGKYSETSWTMPLAVGAKMKHEIRKVVTI